jgi:hypothetical protein
LNSLNTLKDLPFFDKRNAELWIFCFTRVANSEKHPENDKWLLKGDVFHIKKAFFLAFPQNTFDRSFD